LETEDNEAKAMVLKLRIDAELHAELIKKSKASGHKQTFEAIRLIRKGLAQEDVLGVRSDGGFDLMLAFSTGGPQAVINELMDRHGVTVGNLAAWSKTHIAMTQ
jgi:hypothetical protein